MSNTINSLIKTELDRYENDINKINYDIRIDCVTIFSTSTTNYYEIIEELKTNRLIDNMSSGNLYYLSDPINTKYGKLYFIKVRKHDDNYNNYRISVDFVVNNYDEYKSKLNDPVVKKYNTFEMIQFKTDKTIINIVSLSAIKDYKIEGE